MSEEAGPAPPIQGREGEGRTKTETRPISLLRNRVSVAGIYLAAMALTNAFFLLLIVGADTNPYIGIFAYVLFPIVVAIGLLLVPVGVLLERRRRRKLAPGEVPRYVRIDLNVPAMRHTLLTVGGLTVVLLVASATASYRAYRFTDTVAFCGETCHTPMRPEFTAYQHSPHARVACVDCHVGPGAGWFVRSKITGSYQVYAVILNAYPRPIATPIKFLRPVRAACEQCHWPAKFYGEQLKVFTHYASDETNTPTQISMLIKTGGGGGGEFIRPEGIHWHMAIANQVRYIAADRQEQEIPWVEVRGANGRVVDYLAKDSSLKPKQIEAMPRQVVDCVTCHSRPSHQFLPPDEAVNEALAAGEMDASLPYLKGEAVKVLADTYPSTETAESSIATGLDRFYYEKYPQLYNDKQTEIRQSIATVQQIYRNNMFPYMKVDWRTHPDNLGHLYYAGCFRCHDGQHVATDGSGRTIPSDCATCHTILSEGPPQPATGAAAIVTFKHPIDLTGMPTASCFACHTGGTL